MLGSSRSIIGFHDLLSEIGILLELPSPADGKARLRKTALYTRAERLT